MYILVLTRGVPCLSGDHMLGIFENDQAKALSMLGNKIVVLGIDLRSIRHKRKMGLSDIVEGGIHYYQFSFPLGRGTLFLQHRIGYWCFKKAIKAIERDEGKPEIIHAHFANSVGYWAYLANKNNGFNYIVTEHSSELDSSHGISRHLAACVKKVYCHSLGNIAVSQDFANSLAARYDAPFQCIPNIVDNYFLNLKREPKGNQIFNFLFIGNLIPDKGCKLLIEAFARIKECFPSVSLTIIGGGDEYQNLKKQADLLGLGKDVLFTGKLTREGMGAYLINASCFVLPSYHETFGVAYVEAMASGLPVIATKCGGPNHIVNEKNGVLCEVGSVDSLFSAMCFMHDNLQNFNQIYIRNYACANFSSFVVGKQIEAFINKSLSLHKGLSE
jgi:glycosyltransferase involved in cell wall biosynthesis